MVTWEELLSNGINVKTISRGSDEYQLMWDAAVAKVPSAEYCFATENPALFINTKIKANNPNWEKLGVTPVEIKFRTELGVNVNKEEPDVVDETVKKLMDNREDYKTKINEYFSTFTFNHGNAGEIGAQYVLKSIIKKKNKQ